MRKFKRDRTEWLEILESGEEVSAAFHFAHLVDPRDGAVLPRFDVFGFLLTLTSPTVPIDIAEVVLFALFVCVHIVPVLHTGMNEAQRAASIAVLGKHIGKPRDDMGTSCVVRFCDIFSVHL